MKNTTIYLIALACFVFNIANVPSYARNSFNCEDLKGVFEKYWLENGECSIKKASEINRYIHACEQVNVIGKNPTTARQICNQYETPIILGGCLQVINEFNNECVKTLMGNN